MANSVNFQVGLTVDKTGFNELQNAFKQVQEEAERVGLAGETISPELQKASQEAEKLARILNSSWNGTLNQLDLSRLNTSINTAYGSMSNLKNIMESSGTTGAAAYNKLASSILGTNLQIRQSSKFLDDMATTMGNTLKWGVASSAMNTLVGSIQSAWSFAQKLDTSLNNIRIVTSKSAEDMAEFAVQANNAAKALGASTTDYTNASLIYYQQGLSDEEVAARTDVTLKTANVTGQAAREVSEELTAVWNGYQRTSEEAESSIDMLAAVAANTASNLEELATGMSTVASAANAMGVSEEQLTAQLSTIISATRQAPEMTGRALRTIYARMSTINAGGIDEEDGATLTSYTAKMEKFGISVLDVNGKLRDMGDVIEEIGGEWDTFTREQQVAIAQTMAGTRQYNNIMALFENWDEYERALDIAQNSVGTLQEQQDIYMESTEAHLQQLSTTAESAYNNIFDMSTVNTMIDAVTALVGVIANLFDSFGGGLNTLAMLGVMGANVFNNQIGAAIERQIVNTQILKQNEEALQAVQNTADLGVGETDSQRITDVYKAQAETQREILNLSKQIGSEEYNRLTNLNNEITTLSLQLAKYEDIGDTQITLEEANASLEKTTQELRDQTNLYSELETAKERILEYDQASGRSDAIDELNEQISLTEFLVTLNDNEFLTEQEKAAVKEAEWNLANDEIPLEESLNTILQAQEGAVSRANIARQEAEKLVKDIAEYDGSDLEALRVKIDALQRQLHNGTMDENGNFLLGIDQQAQQQAISQVTRGLTSMVMGINAVTNAIRVLSNDSLSPWEKFSQIASNLVFTMPMLTSGLSSLTSFLPNLAVAFGANAAATTSWGAAFTYLDAAIAPFLPVIIAVGAAIGTVVAVGTVLYNTYTSDAKAAENAAKAASELAESNDQVAESLTNVKNAIDSYDDARSKIDDCTQGTQEWRDAIASTNDAAIALINSLSGLSASDIRELYSRDSNGLINFDSNKLQELVDGYQQMANAAEVAAGIGQFNASQAAITSDITNVSREASPLPWFDNLTGYIQDQITDNLSDFAGLGKDTVAAGEKLEALGITADRLGQDNFDTLCTKVIDLADQSEAAAAKLKLIADIEVSEALGDEYDEVVQEMAATQLTQLTDEYTQAWKDQLTGREISRISNATNEVYQKALQELQQAGFNYTEAASNAVRGTGANRRLAFSDENGEEVVRGADWIASTLGAYEAMAELSQNAEGAAQALNNLETAAPEAADSIKSFITDRNFENITGNQRTALQTGIEEAGDVDTYLQQALGLTSEELAQYLGDGYAEAFEQSLADYDMGLKTMTDGMRQSAADAFKDLNLDSSELTLSMQKSIANMLENALDYGGADAMSAVQAGLRDALEENVLDTFVEVVDELSDAWGTVEVEDFVQALDAAGIQTDVTSQLLYDFVDAMNAAGSATGKTADELREAYADIHSVIDGLSDRGTISSDQYTELMNSGLSGISQYFDYMLDGTYRLTTSAEKFQSAVQDQLIDRFTQQIERNTGRQEALQNTQTRVESQGGYQAATQSIDYTAARGTGKIDTGTIDTDALKEQIQLLRDLDTVEAQTLGQWEDAIDTNNVYISTITAINEALADSEDAYNSIEDTVAAFDEENYEIQLGIAQTATSIEELYDLWNSDALTDEGAFNKVYDELYEMSRMEGLDADAVKDYSKYLQQIAEDSDELADSLANDSDAAEDLAVQILRMNNGVETLSKNWDNWNDMLKNSSKESEEYASALKGTQNALSDLLDIESSFLSENYIKDNLDDIALAADGDADAIDRLRQAAFEDILLNIELEDEDLREDLITEMTDLQSFLDENLLEVGASIGEIEGADNYIDSLNALIDATGMTSNQVQAMLSAMGYNVEFEQETENVPSKIPVTTTVHEITALDYQNITGTNPDGTEFTTKIPTWTTKETSHTEYEDVEAQEGVFSTQIETAGGMTGGGDISTTAHVANITKKASGASNNYSGRNAGGNGGKGGSGGGGGGGGGGSGSGSEPNVEEHIEDQADRYHDVNVRLQEISRSLSRLQDQENKLLGSNLINNLNKQLSLLNQQIDVTAQKIVIAQEEAQEYRDKLTEKGALFDVNGDITNYAEIMQAQLDIVNATIDAYNAMSAEEQEEFEDTLEQVKQDYEDFVSWISDYEELILTTIPDLVDDQQAALDQEIQINIQKFTAEIAVRLDMREAEKDWNEFYRKVVLGISDTDIYGNAVQDLADVLSYFDTTASDVFHRRGNDIEDWTDAIRDAIDSADGTGTLQKLTEQIYDTIDQLDAMYDGDWATVYGDNQAQALEDLQTYYSELMNELEDIYDLTEDITNAYLDMIDEAIDKFDQQVDQYEYINDLLNHDIELIGLLYGDDAYAEMARYYQQIEDNNNQELDFLRKRVDYAYEMMQAETDDEAREKWQEEWENALSELNDKVEDAVQNIIDKYSNTINQIISELNDAVTNGLGLDYVSDEWDLINQAADIYLDQINEAYEIQAIRNKYLEAIDATDSVYAQQKLNEAMEMELSYLEEKDNLTQTDVDRAELLYQITLAQIALDEAQQNKSTMRLRRDSQGNYTYQYVSDQDEVAQAQQELLDLQNQLYNFDKNAYQENLDDLYSIYEEFQEKLLELYEDQTLSAEEREQQIALYVEYYGEIINDLVTENTYLRMNLEQSAFEELAALYDFDVENFRNMSEEEIDELMTNLVPQWDSGVQHMADTFAGEGGFIPTCKEAFEELNQATLDYQNSLDELEAAAGIDFASIASGYDVTIQYSQSLLSENEALIDSYAREISAVQDLIRTLDDLRAAYDDVYEAAVRAAEAGYDTYQYYQSENADAYRDAYYEALEGSYTSTPTVVSTIPTYTPEEVSETPTPVTTTQGNGIPEVGDTATYTGGLYYYDSYGTSPTGSRGAGGTVTITQVKTDGRPYPIHVESTNSAYGWLKQSQLSGYDTGGYTGEWENGDDGAVALLHQKELVLNQTDTENILTAVGLVRDMSAMLSALDTSVLARMSDLKSSLIDNLAEKFENGNQELEQNVHIEASFPNVRDSQEIEDAFNNLVNIASMHAYRTQR